MVRLRGCNKVKTFQVFITLSVLGSVIEFAEPEFPNSEPVTFFRTPNPRGEGSAGSAFSLNNVTFQNFNMDTYDN